MKNLPLTICTIIKNEADNLPPFLEALKRFGLLEKLLLVDTGSTDKSLEILSRHGINPLFHEWQADFAEAKNYAVDQAKTDWVLILDADEFLREFPTKEVDALILGSDSRIQAGHMKGEAPRRLQPGETISPPAGRGSEKPDSASLTPASGKPQVPPPGRIIRDNLTPQGLRTERITRLFHRGFYHYEGRIHEQLTLFPASGEPSPLQERLPDSAADLGIRIEHVGYQEGVVREKALRDKQLLEAELQQEKDSGILSYLHYQMARCCRILEDPAEAVRYYEKALPFIRPDAPLQGWERDAIDDYGYALLELKQPEKALCLENYFDQAHTRADYLLVLGLIYMENGRLQDALNAFLLAQNTPDCAAEGANSYLPAYNSGVILECAGDTEGARQAYLSCGKYEKAQEGIGRLNGSNRAG